MPRSGQRSVGLCRRSSDEPRSGCRTFGLPLQGVPGLLLARLDWLSLEPIPESFEAFGHLLGCLPAHDQWDEGLADAVAFEVDVDSDPAPVPLERLDVDVYAGADGSVDATHGPVGGWVELGHHRCGGPV